MERLEGGASEHLLAGPDSYLRQVAASYSEALKATEKNGPRLSAR